MRRFFISLLSIAAVSAMQAAEVSQQKALATAKAFMSQFVTADNSKQSVMRASSATEGDAVSLSSVETGMKEVHAFNMSDGRGFVIVSGSDRTEAVLGYSTSGTINANMPPAMKSLLRSYAAQVTEAEQGGGEATEQTTDVFTVKQPVEPIIKAKWYQEEPYSNMLATYVDKKGVTQHYLTGCVATAMAMVVRHFQWPQQTAFIPAAENTPDMPATSFDWAAMTDKYDKSSPKEACDAVAKLMMYCGGACKMRYAIDAGVSDTYKLAYGMVRYFGYDAKSINVSRRSMMSECEWQELIYQELAEQRPVICGGDGHEIIIDGYRDGDYYHINWGWGGIDDGYFKLSAVNQYQTKAQVLKHFPYDAVTGIRPTTVPYVTRPQTVSTNGIIIDTNTPLQMQRTGDTDFPEVRALLGVDNNCEGFQDYSFDLGMALFKGDEVLQFFEVSDNQFIKAGGYLNNIDVSMTFGQGLANGEYRLCPVSRVHGTEEWLTNEDVAPTYINAIIKDDKLTLDVFPCDHRLKVNSITFSGAMTEGSEVTAVANITNGSNSNFDGMFILVDDVDGTIENEQSLTETYHPLAAGETADVVFKFIAGTPKTYNARLNYESFLIGDGVPFVISAAGEKVSTEINIKKTAVLKNATPYKVGEYTFYDVAGRVVDATVTLKNTSTDTTYKGEVTAEVYVNGQKPDDPLVKKAAMPVQQVTIAPGQSIDVQIHCDKLQLMESQYLNFVTLYGDRLDKDPEQLLMSINTQKGINVFHTDGSVTSYAPAASFTVPADAAVVEMLDCGVTTLTPNDNPNCLYYIYDKDAVPASLQGGNVVKYGTGTVSADNITLHDGYDFITPMAFEAKNITYTRTFTEAEQRDYITIMLPFDAQSCDAGDEDFSLQLQEFYGDQPGVVYVREARELPLGGKPYLMRVKSEQPLAKPITFRAANAFVCDSVGTHTAGVYYFTGAFRKTQLTASENFAFADGQSGTAIPAAVSCSPFRAYFTPIDVLPTGYNDLVIDDQTFAPTAISVVPAADSAAQQSGSLRTTGDAAYNLSGQRVSSAYKGIIIHNGKKIVIK